MYRQSYVNKNIEIVRFGGKLIYKTVIKGERNKQTGRWIKDELIKLGPTYVKIGQTMSTRKDIFPEYVTTELKTLQDKMPEMTYDEVVNIIESEFGKGIDEIYENVSRKPIAGASISQVHKARLKNKKLVAVKIQRPNIQEMYVNDMKYISKVTNVLSYINWKQIDDILLIINETSKNIEEELDFKKERENMLLFQKIYEEDDTIRVPKVYSKMTTKRVLTMEYIQGIKIDDINELEQNEIELEELSDKLMSKFIESIMRYGVLHADPHAGNLSVKNGQIVLYDYGIISKFDVDVQNTFREILKSYLQNDVKGIMEILIRDEILYPIESKSKELNGLTTNEYVILFKITSYILEYTKSVDIKKLSYMIEGDTIINVNDIPFRINAKMIVLFNAMTKLEGVCKTINPEFAYTNILMRYIDNTVIIDKMLTDVNSLFMNINKKEDDIQLKSDILKLEKKNEWGIQISMMIILIECIMLMK